ncbi:MAG TPA: EamA family transporter [Candidatus Limnocylindrales bacterium]|nr:EamA family transporter [Candidatus Limnocylindrales bacterium]
MPPVAIALVVTAAILHATWNTLLKTSGDPLRTAVRLQLIGTLVLAPISLVAWLTVAGRPAIPVEVLALVLVSGLLEAVYFACLAAAYRRGDLSLVYPLARGSAPLLAVIIGVTLLQEQLAPVAALGVACLLVGVLLVARPWRVLREAGAHDRAAVGFALATGASIAAYSAIDRVAVRLVEPWVYGGLLAVAATILLGSAVWVATRAGWIMRGGDDAALPSWRRDGAAGILSLGAYLLVLFAYSIAPLATVAPLRESSVVLASLWGVARLGEGGDRRDAGLRVAAGLLVLVGAVLLAVGR